MESEIKRRRNKKKRQLEGTKSNPFFSFFSRFEISIIFTLLVLIFCKKSEKNKALFYKMVFEQNFSFAQVNNWYQKQFGSPIPFQNLIPKEEIPVFQEKLTYRESSLYLDGVSLIVEKDYLVPVLDSGLVVFQGQKEGYGNTIIIQGNDGVDIWYGHLKEINVSLYQYVEKGTLLGSTDETLYLVFKKGGTVLDYNDYI